MANIPPQAKVLSKKEKKVLEKKKALRKSKAGTFSYSSRRILRKRKGLLFKLGLIDALCFILFFIIFAGYKLFEFYFGGQLGIPELDNQTNLLLVLGYLVFVILFMGLIHLKNFNAACRAFKEFYYELLVEECQLEERSLFLNKEALSDAELKEIMLFVQIPKLWITKSYTLTSSLASFDISSLSYGKNHNVVILRTQTDVKYPHLLQIRSDGKEGPGHFNGEKIEKYGISNAELSKEFTVFTSMTSEVYKNLGQDLFKHLREFKELIKCPFVVTFFKNDLVIYIDGWTINLQRELTDKEDIYFIDTQIEVLKLFETHLNAFATIMEEKSK